LIANGIRVFGHHFKDGAPLGIFCGKGQCTQCSVIADGLPVKSCIVPVKEGMAVAPMDGKPVLPDVNKADVRFRDIETLEVECLIIGGGPAGLSAAIELAKAGVGVILVDDKARLGGELVLQTHKFFGSIEACHAGTRGMNIGAKLEKEVQTCANVRVWTKSNVLAVFSDRKVGVLKEGQYLLVQPHVLLVATGAREKSLVFKGNTLPGVYSVGVFQMLVNRDLVRPSERLFIIGGGNVGFIAAYHALQAGIQVVGLCEALPECSGYKVHKDNLARMGVPIYTSHTVVSANGKEEVESITIAQLDPEWGPIPGTARTFKCDTVLVAVGLEPVNEFTAKAKEYGLPVFTAGDAEEVAEASAAMLTGRIRGLEIARSLGRDVGEVPPEWHRTAEILKARPGSNIFEEMPEDEKGVFLISHCSPDIPCNVCTSIFPPGSLKPTSQNGEMLRVPTLNEHDYLAC
jgi:thioredoxin reductase